jgi:hypothetical protein
MKASIGVSFMQPLLEAITKERQTEPTVSARMREAVGVDGDGGVPPISLPSAEMLPFQADDTNTSGVGGGFLRGSTTSLTTEDTRDILESILGRRSSPNALKVPFPKPVKARRNKAFNIPVRSHEQYLHFLSLPKKKTRSVTPSPRRVVSQDSQSALVTRLVRPRSIEAVIRKYSRFVDDIPMSDRSIDDPCYIDVHVPRHRSVSLGAYELELKTLIPIEPQRPALRSKRLHEAIHETTSRILDFVQRCEKVVQIDNWVAKKLEVEILPSLTHSFPTQNILHEPPLDSPAPRTNLLLECIKICPPNKLVLIRLQGLERRIIDKLNRVIAKASEA